MIIFIGENLNSLSGGGVATRSNLQRLTEEFGDDLVKVYEVPYKVNNLYDKFLGLVFGTTKPLALMRFIVMTSPDLVWIDRSTYVWLFLLYPFMRTCRWRVYMHNNEVKYHRDLAVLNMSVAAWLRVIILSCYMWLCRIPFIDLYTINPDDKKNNQRVTVWLPRFVLSEVCSGASDVTINRPYFLVIGSLFAPNIEGIKWLRENVSYAVDDQFLIIGKGLTPELLALEESDNFHVLGEVEEIQPYIEASVATIAPIWYGSGLKIKIAESIVYGKHCIASESAAEPFKAILGEQYGNYISTFSNEYELIEILRNKYFNSNLQKGRFFID